MDQKLIALLNDTLKETREIQLSNDNEINFNEIISSFLDIKSALAELTLKNNSDPRNRDIFWVENIFSSQGAQYLIDCLPSIQNILRENFIRQDTLSFVDVGPGVASGANILSTLHKEHAIWCQLKIDALDMSANRKNFSNLMYPNVNFIVGKLDKIKRNHKWDIVYSSAVIEHVPDPDIFMQNLLDITDKYLFVYTPYKEGQPRSPGHIHSFDKDFFIKYNPVDIKIIKSMGWYPGKNLEMILAVFKK